MAQAHYDVSINKNDNNDQFDENQLLRHVPGSYIEKAKRLLKFFNKYPEEITWNSDGVIFIDQTSIPNSNIYQLFPQLFNKFQTSSSKSSRNMYNGDGLLELVEKIKEIHLDHLIEYKLPIPSEKALAHQGKLDDLSSNDSDDDAWWFIGV